MDPSANLEILETSELSNIIDINSEVKKQSTQLMNWFFTFNNYTLADIEILETFFKQLCFKYCFQQEIAPSTGTPHLQGIISLKKRARWSEFGLPKKISWFKPRNVTHCYLYCSDIRKRDPEGKVFYMNFTPKTGNLKLINPTKWWQIEILNIITEEPDERKVYWYWSNKGGIGKSQFCKYLLVKNDCVFIDEGKKADIMHCVMSHNMDLKNIVIFDVPRDNGNKVSYKSIESIKNGMIFSSKYESGYKIFNSPHLFVFANVEPDYSCLSDDRWVVKNIDE
jgi:hypothetical protein